MANSLTVKARAAVLGLRVGQIGVVRDTNRVHALLARGLVVLADVPAPDPAEAEGAAAPAPVPVVAVVEPAAVAATTGGSEAATGQDDNESE